MFNFKLLCLLVLLISCFVIQGNGEDAPSQVNKRNDPLMRLIRSRRQVTAAQNPLVGLFALLQIWPTLLSSLMSPGGARTQAQGSNPVETILNELNAGGLLSFLG